MDQDQCEHQDHVGMENGFDDDLVQEKEGECTIGHEESNTAVDEGIPKIGMVFQNLDVPYDYYNKYVRRIGFSVRIQRTNKNKKNPSTFYCQTLCCSYEGYYHKVRTLEKRRHVKRFGYLTEFHVQNVGGQFLLKRFESEHTHLLVHHNQAHFLKSQRNITSSQAGLIETMHSAGMPPYIIFSYLSREARGDQFLNFIRYDCYNHIQQIQNRCIEKGDVYDLEKWLREKKQQDKHFFYSFLTNEDEHVRGVFFCDAKSRRDYGLFGDVLCFDTTFYTNKYNMVCAPLIGANNHGKTIIFGCGLLDSETTEAITWLFTIFMEAMGGKKPQTILTAQSFAIAGVINIVFLEDHWCR